MRSGEGKWSDLIPRGENLQGFKAPTSTKDLNHSEAMEALLVFTQRSREMSALPQGLRDRREQLVVKEMDESIKNIKNDTHPEVTWIRSQKERKPCGSCSVMQQDDDILERRDRGSLTWDLPTEMGKWEGRHTV